jgi:hypothetical protein
VLTIGTAFDKMKTEQMFDFERCSYGDTGEYVCSEKVGGINRCSKV